MELSEAIKKRRSIRAFYTSLDIPLDKVIEIIQAALLAPSAGDLQPWSFVVIKDREKIEKLANLTGEDWLVSANLLIAVVGNTKIYDFYFKEFGCELLNQSIGACIENMLLKATELGIGSCWVAGFEKEPVNELLSVPKNKDCLAIVALGIPAEKVKKKTVKSLFTSVFWEEYGKKSLGEASTVPDLVEKIFEPFQEE